MSLSSHFLCSSQTKMGSDRADCGHVTLKAKPQPIYRPGACNICLFWDGNGYSKWVIMLNTALRLSKIVPH